MMFLQIMFVKQNQTSLILSDASRNSDHLEGASIKCPR